MALPFLRSRNPHPTVRSLKLNIGFQCPKANPYDI